MANFEKIRQLRDYLKDLSETPEPEYGFGMEAWVFKNGSRCKMHEGFCGTTACLAGHAWILFSPTSQDPESWDFEPDPWPWADEPREILNEGELGIDVREEAGAELDLDFDEYDHMFHGLWASKPLPEITLEEAVDYLTLVLDCEDVLVYLD